LTTTEGGESVDFTCDGFMSKLPTAVLAFLAVALFAAVCVTAVIWNAT
jgi:hypothetical protein